MRDEEGWLCFSCGNQITQFAIISFHVGLAGAYVLAFYPKWAKIESDLALLGKLILGARILRNENADHPDTAGRAHGLDQIIHRQVRYLMAVVVATLITDAFAAAVSADTAGQRQYLLYARAVRVIDGNSANFFGKCQPVLVHINHHHLAGALDYGRVRRH